MSNYRLKMEAQVVLDLLRALNTRLANASDELLDKASWVEDLREHMASWVERWSEWLDGDEDPDGNRNDSRKGSV